MRRSRQSIRTIAGGTCRIKAAASPAIARRSEPSMPRPSIVTCSSMPATPDAPQVVVGTEPRAVGGRALDLDDQLARRHVLGQLDPVAVVEPGPHTRAVEHERRVADEGQNGFGGTDRELLDPGRRRPQQTPAVGRPHSAVRRHGRLVRRLDLERDRLTAEGEQGGLRCRRCDDDQTVAPDSRDGVGLGEGRHREPGTEPECRRIDQSGFGVRAVEEVGAHRHLRRR